MKRAILSSFVACSFVCASSAAAETLPFSELVGNISENDLLQLPPDFYYVLDAKAGLAWVLNAETEFAFLAGLTAHDGEVHVLRNGIPEFSFPVDMPVTTVTYDGFRPEMLPASRPLLSNLDGKVTVSELEGVLPAGSKFGSQFTVQAPDGQMLMWAPEETGSGIIVINFDSDERRYIPVDVLQNILAEGLGQDE